jgi:hypothetical protein
MILVSLGNRGALKGGGAAVRTQNKNLKNYKYRRHNDITLLNDLLFSRNQPMELADE